MSRTRPIKVKQFQTKAKPRDEGKIWDLGPSLLLKASVLPGRRQGRYLPCKEHDAKACDEHRSPRSTNSSRLSGPAAGMLCRPLLDETCSALVCLLTLGELWLYPVFVHCRPVPRQNTFQKGKAVACGLFQMTFCRAVYGCSQRRKPSMQRVCSWGTGAGERLSLLIGTTVVMLPRMAVVLSLPGSGPSGPVL